VRIREGAVFLLCPFTFVDVWIQVIVPTLPALFPQPSLELPRNKGPFLIAVLLNEPDNRRIFLWRPRTFYEARFQDFLPSVQALNVSSVH
jgi:hypothetical protein